MHTQWNPSAEDTIGNQHFVPHSEVSLPQGLNYGILSIFLVLHNEDVEHVATFHCFSLLYAGGKAKQRL